MNAVIHKTKILLILPVFFHMPFPQNLGEVARQVQGDDAKEKFEETLSKIVKKKRLKGFS